MSPEEKEYQRKINVCRKLAKMELVPIPDDDEPPTKPESRKAAQLPGFRDGATTKNGQRLLVFINEEFAQKSS